MTPILVRVLAITGMLFFSAMSQHAIAQDSANLPYMNPQLSPEQRATDLVGRMTLAEKAWRCRTTQLQCRGSKFRRISGGAKLSTA